MNDLDELGQQLLALLVARLPEVIAGNPASYISYKDVHTALGLSQRGTTFGESLKLQGLNSLAEWTASTKKPAITGLIIDRTKLMPGDGYFKLFGKTSGDFEWWKQEITRSKSFNWAPYLPISNLPDSAIASDLTPPERKSVTTCRIIRDTVLAKRIKLLHQYECQLCGHTIILADGSRYAEAHHICPLGTPHNGPDIAENIICVCPNHHAELDFGARELRLEEISVNPDHSVGAEFLEYHNKIIRATTP